MRWVSNAVCWHLVWLWVHLLLAEGKQWKPSHSDSEAVTIFQPENSFFIYISSCGLIFMWLLFKFLALFRRFNALSLMRCQLEREFHCADSDRADFFGLRGRISPTVSWLRVSTIREEHFHGRTPYIRCFAQKTDRFGVSSSSISPLFRFHLWYLVTS